MTEWNEAPPRGFHYDRRDSWRIKCARTASESRASTSWNRCQKRSQRRRRPVFERLDVARGDELRVALEYDAAGVEKQCPIAMLSDRWSIVTHQHHGVSRRA